MEDNIKNSPMGYDYHKKLSADDIIKAKRENRKYARERDKRIEAKYNESNK